MQVWTHVQGASIAGRRLAWCGGDRAVRLRLKVLVGGPRCGAGGWGRAGSAVGPLVVAGSRHSSNGRAGGLLRKGLLGGALCSGCNPSPCLLAHMLVQICKASSMPLVGQTHVTTFPFSQDQRTCASRLL